MPRARSASTMRGSIVAGNGAYTGGRAGKRREAVMQGPVEAEINRSSRISPSIAPTVSWRRETPRFLAATGRVDGDDRVVFHGGVQRRSDEQNPRPTLSLALPRRRRGGAGGAARDHAQDRAFHRVRRARGALVRGPHARARTVAAARGVGGA